MTTKKAAAIDPGFVKATELVCTTANPCANEDCIDFKTFTYQADGQNDADPNCLICAHFCRINFYRVKEG